MEAGRPVEVSPATLDTLGERDRRAGMAEAVKDVPGFADAPGVVTVGGGVPIFSADGKMFLGAAAASGEAPEDDASCVEAGIKAAGLSAQRAR